MVYRFLHDPYTDCFCRPTDFSSISCKIGPSSLTATGGVACILAKVAVEIVYVCFKLSFSNNTVTQIILKVIENMHIQVVRIHLIPLLIICGVPDEF